MPSIFFKFKKILNPGFWHIVHLKVAVKILWGGRGSSKSDFAAKYLLYRCVKSKFFRFLLVRNVYKTVKGSQWQNLYDTATDLGIDHLFEFNSSPIEITCKLNGNKFIGVGCDDVTKLKSIKDPTGVWYEEDIIDESDYITIKTGIRTKKADRLEEIWTINPEVEGDYQDNWFWKKFFKNHSKKTFEGQTETKIPSRDVFVLDDDGVATGEKYSIPEQVVLEKYYCHHSTYHFNPHISDSFIAMLESLKLSNPYYYSIYCLGEFGNKVLGDLCYKRFDRAKHICSIGYDESKRLYISFDFNVRPYVTITIHQLFDRENDYDRYASDFRNLDDYYGMSIDKIAVQVDEITAKYPNNSTEGACSIFRKRYHSHMSGVHIYGDPSGKNEDTRSTGMLNDYTIITSHLKGMSPRLRVANSAPSVTNRIDFINHQLATASGGLAFAYNRNCTETILDYTLGKENYDGTKFKEKVRDKETQMTYEKRHHITDANDYFYAEFFVKQFYSYLSGVKKGGREVGNDRKSVTR